MKKTTIFIIVCSLCISLFLAGCAGVEQKTTSKTPDDVPSADYCDRDSDCICGGVDKRDQRCFLGNKAYYDAYVDKQESCPDFCGGLDGNLAVKCVDNKCVQMYECITDMECDPGQRCKNNKCSGKSVEVEGCRNDGDCVTGGCSGTVCQSRGEEPVFTTCEMRPEYECYKMIDCGCVSGECEWKNTPEFDRCVETKKTGPE